MKLLIYILSIIAVILIIYNATKLNFNALFNGESLIAVCTIIAGLCAIILLQIIRLSNIINTKSRRK